MQPEADSTVPRRQLGRFLRRLREDAGLRVNSTADAMGCSVQKVWRIETGATAVRPTDVQALCGLYGADEQTTSVLARLARQTRATGWWQSYGDAVPDWFELYVGLEGAASRIRKFEPSLIPGLLQSRAYMQAVIEAEQPHMTVDERRHRVSIKTERQRLLTRHFPPPPQLEVIVCESVLRRPPETPGALQQQLFHLLEANLLPHVSVRVLPLAAGPHRASASAAFTILDFPVVDAKPVEPTTVYSEGLTGALYLDRPHEIDTYNEVWSALVARALDEGQSSETITAIMRELDADARPDRRHLAQERSQ